MVEKSREKINDKLDGTNACGKNNTESDRERLLRFYLFLVQVDQRIFGKSPLKVIAKSLLA